MNDKELLKAWRGAFDKDVPLVARNVEEIAEEILLIRLRAVAQVSRREVVERYKKDNPSSYKRNQAYWNKLEKEWGI